MTPYTPPRLLINAHLETIYPSLFRRIPAAPYERERIPTPDSDFLDLDWLRQGSSRLIIISHGLEGNSSRAYVRGMAKAFFDQGFDILAWNYRGCSEEMNLQLRFYHSGATDDLATIIRHAALRYSDICLIGFSLGGNLTAKYLGEQGQATPVRKAVAFSVPMDLHSSCLQISRRDNWIYSRRFLKSLKLKVIQKARLRGGIDVTGIDRIPDLITFDDRYTAPIHGFTNALTYYKECSSARFVENITVPTLIVNALNDPFLTPECSPIGRLQNHPKVILENPRRGGHVGFSLFGRNGLYWSELRALEFINS